MFAYKVKGTLKIPEGLQCNDGPCLGRYPTSTSSAALNSLTSCAHASRHPRLC